MEPIGMIVLLVAAFTTSDVLAQPPPLAPPLRMANVYGDHMVLQQAPARANVWGYAEKCDSKLSVSFDGKQYRPRTFTDSKGRCVWAVSLLPTKASAVGKSYRIMVTSDKYGTAAISDVLFGDVWVCSGQSNMQFTVPQAYNAKTEIKVAAQYPQIRLFTASLNLSTTPQSELLGVEQEWSVAGPKTVGGGNWTYFSATCWFFGRDLFNFLKYPIGLIATDWGGTPVEAWSSPDALDMCKSELKGSPIMKTRQNDHSPREKSYEAGPNDPSVLWNAMIYPFLNMTIKGAIWYQGEANAGHPDSYNCTFPAMIDDWREKWYAGSMNQTTPLYFGFAQLAPNGNTNTTVGGFPVIRWAQTANYGYVPNKRMKNVFMAVTIDLGDPMSPFGSIHPRNKQDVGARLSMGARKVAYNDPTVYYLGLLPQSTRLETGSKKGYSALSIGFGPPNDKGRLELRYPYGFEIGCSSSTAATQWIEGTAKTVSGNSVLVEFPLCPVALNPTKVRYCWRTDPCSPMKCPIYSSALNTSPPFMMDLGDE